MQLMGNISLSLWFTSPLVFPWPLFCVSPALSPRFLVTTEPIKEVRAGMLHSHMTRNKEPEESLIELWPFLRCTDFSFFLVLNIRFQLHLTSPSDGNETYWVQGMQDISCSFGPSKRLKPFYFYDCILKSSTIGKKELRGKKSHRGGWFTKKCLTSAILLRL